MGFLLLQERVWQIEVVMPGSQGVSKEKPSVLPIRSSAFFGASGILRQNNNATMLQEATLVDYCPTTDYFGRDTTHSVKLSIGTA